MIVHMRRRSPATARGGLAHAGAFIHVRFFARKGLMLEGCHVQGPGRSGHPHRADQGAPMAIRGRRRRSSNVDSRIGKPLISSYLGDEAAGRSETGGGTHARD